MNKRIQFYILLGALFLATVFSGTALAQLRSYGSGITVEGLVPNILSVLWIVFGLIVVICFVVAGIMFMTAQGDPAKTQLARGAALWGVVGVIVGILAYSIEIIIERAL